MTRLQGSLDATARALAPSKEAFDTPLSPPPLNDEPGPATGRSGAYPDGTFTREPGPACRTQHAPYRSVSYNTIKFVSHYGPELLNPPASEDARTVRTWQDGRRVGTPSQVATPQVPRPQ